MNLAQLKKTVARKLKNRKRGLQPIPQPRYDEIFQRGCIELFDNRPVVVCLCGSTRFKPEFERVMAEETLKGVVVLSVGVFCHLHDEPVTDEQKEMLDQLHREKIRMADEVFIINVGGYIGESTSNEIAYAQDLGKTLRYLEG